jgi:hypothetical protein
MPSKSAREHAPAPLSRSTPSVAVRRSSSPPRAIAAAPLLDLQRQAGNRATVGQVRRYLAGTLIKANYGDIHKELTEKYLAVPPLWKVQQVMTNPTVGYGSVAEIAAALNLRVKGGVGPTEAQELTTAAQALTTTPPKSTAPPKSMPPESTQGPESTAPKQPATEVVGLPATNPAAEATEPARRPITRPRVTAPPDTKALSTKPPTEAPSKDGTLQVLDMLSIREPTTGQRVFTTPPEYIRVRMDGAEYRVVAGQDFLNTGTSARYLDNASEIKGAKAKLQQQALRTSGEEPPADVRVIGDGHHRFIWSAFHGLPVAAVTTKIGRLAGEPWSGLTYKDAPGSQAPTTPVVKRPPKKAEKATAGPTGASTTKAAEIPASWPSMARIQNPDWTNIEPLLASYGITEEAETRAIKASLDEHVKNSDKPIRGIPDLIGRALGSERQTQAALFVRQKNTEMAPVLTKNVMTIGRGDKRYPWEVRNTAGLFGWDPGIVSVAHAKQIVTTIRSMPVPQQQKWIAAWKWPTPSPEERNAWIATGVGKEGGQKGGSGEYFADVPLQSEPSEKSPMIVLTDTGDLSTASVIGVNLKMIGQTKGDEVLVLTGIPWKYITGWWGKIPGHNGEQPKLWDKDTAATLSDGLK